ncbi:LysR substrate-binding domain-containing protein [Roseomonas harenae]|uniref:LysR substrate-binding domain-containing protein n=1 Tax=Muricoccus harenae TaxID=2692566 RepID=UPI0022A68971|nr:LysR substrate-binding domain-containing protein [Roseomonas harenae]
MRLDRQPQRQAQGAVDQRPQLETPHPLGSASVQFGRIYVLPVMTEYMSLHPSVLMRALFVDRVLNMIEEGADVGVRIGHLAGSGMAAIRVGTVRHVVCATPDYLARHGTPATPRDLRDHAVIGSTSIEASPEWRFGRERKVAVTLSPRLICNTVDAALAAAIDGHGIARLLSYQIAPALAESRLTILLEDFEEQQVPIHVVNPDGRRASAKIRTFMELTLQRLRANRMLQASMS